jgi:exodeoxyribonuclease III
MFKVASWNLNSIRSRLTHVTTWLKAREPDVLLLQELKGTEFPSEVFKSLGYESVAVTQKAYNGVAILSRHPTKTIAKALVGDDSDSHARFLEVIIEGIRIVNIYHPSGNPVGSDKFAYKLAWMDRLHQQMIRWKHSARRLARWHNAVGPRATRRRLDHRPRCPAGPCYHFACFALPFPCRSQRTAPKTTYCMPAAAL